MCNWQICSFEQAKQLKAIGIHQQSLAVWIDYNETGAISLVGPNKTNYAESEEFKDKICAAYTLAEIAVMLGYSFVTANVKDAADKLIHEIGIGICKVADCNARLKDVQSS